MNAAHGGPMTPNNLVAGTHAANAGMLTYENHLRTFLGNIARWNVRQNYNVQFVANVEYWSNNLAAQVTAAAENSRGQGALPAEDVLESIRRTFNFILDPYNFGTFAELLRRPR
ncbi:MAG TPA: hypothetical protein VFN10_14350 [Thermoanaerobaculia bacterium]|nr:hypothetical protein [Thermoanaerobaculia bacterium]